MHHAKNMLKSHVFGRWKYPPGRLELMNVSHPLHPGMINQILFSGLPDRQTDSGDKRDVAVNRIVRQAFRGEIANHSILPDKDSFAGYLKSSKHQ